MNNNDEKIFEFPNEYLGGAIDYPDYDLEKAFTTPNIVGDHTFNKANTDLSKGLLSLAGIKSNDVFSSLSGNNGSIVSKLDLGIEKDLLNIKGIDGILNKPNPVLDKNFQGSSGIKSNNVFNKSDIFNSNPLVLGTVSRELPKPLILDDDKTALLKEKPPIIEGLHEMNRDEDEIEKKPAKLLQAIEDAIHELEKPAGHKPTELERYLEQNSKGTGVVNKRLEELSAANKVLEEQIKGLKASNEYLEKQAFELADTNAKLNIQIGQSEAATAEIIKESRVTRRIAIIAILTALVPLALEILRVIF